MVHLPNFFFFTFLRFPKNVQNNSLDLDPGWSWGLVRLGHTRNYITAQPPAQISDTVGLLNHHILVPYSVIPFRNIFRSVRYTVIVD